MHQHAERIRRIQELCAQLDHTIQDAHAVQQTVEELQAESGRLLADLDTKSLVGPDSKYPEGRRR
jgi:hypothetical protein